MPATMMHLLSAHKLWSDGSDEFFLGSIIPDCVDRDRNLKDKLHFRDKPDCEREKGIIEFSKKLDIDNSDVDFGILWHFFLDMEWDRGPQHYHRITYTGEKWFSDYRREISLCGSYIAHEYEFAQPLWERLRKFKNGGFSDKIGFPKDFVFDFVEDAYRWHTTEKIGPSEIFTPELTEEFIDFSIENFHRFMSQNFSASPRLKLFRRQDMNKLLKIIVVCGGTSSEREVSLRSGKAVFDALCEFGFNNLTLFDLKEDNFNEIVAQKPDLCFLALHGAGGEDGVIQRKLEEAGIKYTFSGVKASENAMDKIKSKEIFAENGINTALFLTLNRDEVGSVSEFLPLVKEKIGFPFVAKAPKEGSSIGVVIVKDESAFEKSLEEVFSYDRTILIEKFLDGIEITVPVIGNEVATALPIIEITAENEFYDYEAKYTPGKCRHIIPARISDEERQKASDLATKTYKALGCRGCARVDMIIDKKSGVMVMEVNTIPGMTSMSLVPDSARFGGIEFPELCAKLVSLALE